MPPEIDISIQRKAEIIRAAMTVFSQKGINARMEEISDEAGLSKATIYLYFENKDQLTEAVLASVFSTSIADFECIADVKGETSERLHQVVDEMAVMMDLIKPLFSMYFETMAYALRNPESAIQPMLKHYFSRGRNAVAQIIKDGIEQGDIRMVDADAMALAICAGLDGTVIAWVYDQESINIKEALHDLIDCIMTGMSKE